MNYDELNEAFEKITRASHPTNELKFEGRTYKGSHHPVDPEGAARFHDAPNLERCRECFNLEPYCTCINIPAEVHKIRESMDRHPSRPTIAGVTPEERDRLLKAYAARGAEDIEAFLNGDGE